MQEMSNVTAVTLVLLNNYVCFYETESDQETELKFIYLPNVTGISIRPRMISYKVLHITFV